MRRRFKMYIITLQKCISMGLHVHCIYNDYNMHMYVPMFMYLLYICIYMHIYIYVCVYMHIYIIIYMYISMHMYTRTYICSNIVYITTSCILKASSAVVLFLRISLCAMIQSVAVIQSELAPQHWI